MAKRTATCACGALKAHCLGEPKSVSLCHCAECRKRTGSAFGIAAFYDREKLEIDGAFRDFTRASDSGFSVTFHFCPRCGSNVFWEPARRPDQIAVAAGAFADFPPPSKEVYVERRLPWVPTIRV
ncbi:MAG TPA: GFA family protein [Rhizomicrobium sp.]|nr:GFA family protein [Rhizomicrobium sp.]